MPVGLILGNIQFLDREVPDKINTGGKQMLAVHKQIGGTRVVDAMGPDPDNIKWNGLLLTLPQYALHADARARQIDALRQSGQQVVLTWPGFSYIVVVEHFTTSYKNQWEIRYAISCCVIQDNSTISLTTSTLESSVSGDTAAIGSAATSGNMVAGGGSTANTGTSGGGLGG